MHGDGAQRLKVRLAAPPVDGKANAELLRFLADVFGVPQRGVVLVRGATSRQKGRAHRRAGESAGPAMGTGEGSNFNGARGWPSRTKSATAASRRAPGSMPAASSAAVVASADIALRNVLRRCANAAATTRANSASSAIAGCRRASGTSRATADSTFGTGRNAPGGTTNSRAMRKLRLQHHRQPSVVGGRGRGGHPRDHFPLQHHVEVAQQRVVRRQVEQQRRADVVRQVADDAQPPAQRREVELERVRHVQRQLRGREVARAAAPRDRGRSRSR